MSMPADTGSRLEALKRQRDEDARAVEVFRRVEKEEEGGGGDAGVEMAKLKAEEEDERLEREGSVTDLWGRRRLMSRFEKQGIRK